MDEPMTPGMPTPEDGEGQPTSDIPPTSPLEAEAEEGKEMEPDGDGSGDNEGAYDQQ